MLKIIPNLRIFLNFVCFSGCNWVNRRWKKHRLKKKKLFTGLVNVWGCSTRFPQGVRFRVLKFLIPAQMTFVINVNHGTHRIHGTIVYLPIHLLDVYGTLVHEYRIVSRIWWVFVWAGPRWIVKGTSLLSAEHHKNNSVFCKYINSP